MTTYYGVEQSTDSRCPMTKVTRLGSGRNGLAAAQRFAATKTRLTYADPDAARNYHHTLYTAYEMPPRWKAPTPRQLAEIAASRSTRDYPRRAADVLASLIDRAGTRVSRADEMPSTNLVARSLGWPGGGK